MNHLFEKKFDAATFNEICSRFGIDPLNATLIKEDANLIYDCGDSILRISVSDIRTTEDIEVELDWMDFLYKNSVSIPRLLPSLNQRQQERIDGTEEHFSAVRFEKVVGKLISKETWNTAHFQRLGKLVGKIHRASKGYTRKRHLNYRHWDQLVECSYATLLPLDERRLQELNSRLMSEFRSRERNTMNYGLIHNDVHHENYLLQEDGVKIVLFDFEVTCQSWYLYEIATALYYACLVKRNQNNEDFEQLFLSHFVEGYRSENSLPTFVFEDVLKFMLYRDLFIYGYMLAMWKNKVLPKEITDYLSRLNTSIEVRRNRLNL